MYRPTKQSPTAHTFPVSHKNPKYAFYMAMHRLLSKIKNVWAKKSEATQKDRNRMENQ
jgi:hypothetical protein